MLVYVDDIIFTGNNPSFIKSLVTKLKSEFCLKDLGSLDYFLGIEVRPQPNGALILTQSKYIRDLLGKTKMDEANPTFFFFGRQKIYSIINKSNSTRGT